MGKVTILDCTLRDGGYINDWNFGERTIRKIVKKLADANIDIIECGFLEECDFNENKALFNSVEQIRDYIAPKKENIMYVGMIAQPYISIDKISYCDKSLIDGIRVTFHQDEIEEALVYGKQLMEKGYKVFIQPVGTTSYSDANLLELIDKVNVLKPFAFYLVDTLGIMYKNDLLRMFHLLDNNLNEAISIGFHSHNNLQLSFSNAQELLMLHTKRNIIIDSSVFGMGRGAGNLCTELVTHYINKNIEVKYDTVPLLEIVDEHLSKIFSEVKWGYSIPYFLAAINNCHPNYATYLMNKQTISVKIINTILKQLPIEKRDLYDKNYIEDLYVNHQIHYVIDSEERDSIKELIGNKKILVIAPGKSIETEKESIKAFIDDNQPFVFSVNFISETFKVDAMFISNSKRFEYLSDLSSEISNTTTMITTSNIAPSKDSSALIVNYSDLIINDSTISDNAGMMLIKLLSQLSVSSVYLAGFDGFDLNKLNNYFNKELINNVEVEELRKKNEAISNYIKFISKNMNIYFVTDSLYSNL